MGKVGERENQREEVGERRRGGGGGTGERERGRGKCLFKQTGGSEKDYTLMAGGQEELSRVCDFLSQPCLGRLIPVLARKGGGRGEEAQKQRVVVGEGRGEAPSQEVAWPSGYHFRCMEVSGPSVSAHLLSREPSVSG